MKKTIRGLTLITFILMVVVNALANILPINGIGTGAVSDSYPNLFAPAGITFAIWGVIYLLLAAYTVFQLGLFKKNRSMSDALMNKIGVVFSISSIANTVWIFSWHYGIIAPFDGTHALNPRMPRHHCQCDSKRNAEYERKSIRQVAVQYLLRLDHRCDNREHDNAFGELGLERIWTVSNRLGSCHHRNRRSHRYYHHLAQ